MDNKFISIIKTYKLNANFKIKVTKIMATPSRCAQRLLASQWISTLRTDVAGRMQAERNRKDKYSHHGIVGGLGMFLSGVVLFMNSTTIPVWVIMPLIGGTTGYTVLMHYQMHDSAIALDYLNDSIQMISDIQSKLVDEPDKGIERIIEDINLFDTHLIKKINPKM